MAQGDRQQESLETLKLINAASTALRLYPEESSQVRNSIEKAYQGTKHYLRKNQLLRFSFLNGRYLLNGEPVDNPTRERLQLLTFSSQLQKMELDEMVLSKGFDRPTFKKILSVFSATPEQINRVGGSRAFIDSLKLAAIFPEAYWAPGESEEEKRKKRKVDQILKELSGGVVRSEHILYLVGRKKESALQRTLEEIFQVVESGAHIVAATTYSLVQILHKDHIVVVAPAFSKMLATISSLLSKEQYNKVSDAAATLLAPHLDQCVILMLLCQDFSSPFGEIFYKSLLRMTDTETLTKVIEWIQGQQKQDDGKKSDKFMAQLQVISKAYEKLAATSRGKQVIALGTTKVILQQTERGRKGARLQSGITALAKGNLASLKNSEVCQNLPATIEKLLANDKESVAAAIIQNVVKGLAKKDHELRPQLALALGAVAYKLSCLNRWDWLEKLTPVCLAWIRENEVADRSLEKNVLAMQAMMNHAWYSDNNSLAEDILDVFYYIRSGAFEKNDEIRKLVGRIQDKNVDVLLLRGYLERCFVRPVDEMICRKIIMQGPVAARFLLDTLIASDKRADRIRLLKILSELGADLVPVLLERLPDPMPWYGKRNIIRLLAVTGSEEDVEEILSYASHDDLRVQQEVLQCILRTGKSSTARYLVAALSESAVQTKIQVVRNLRPLADESLVEPLAGLLSECSFYGGADKKTLALEISKTLGATDSSMALVPLQSIIDGGRNQFGQESVRAAKLAVALIEEKENSQRSGLDARVEKHQEARTAAVESVVKSVPPPVAKEYEPITDYPEEREVYALLGKDKAESAKKILSALIEKTAQLRKFNEAEALRLRLIDIDAMALAEIIRAAEIIEDAKSNSIDQGHILIWSDLYDLLTTEEFNVLYHSLEHETYPTETVIVKQGDPQWRLFFVNKGRVKLYFNEKENETLVKTVGPGNVFGGASFFDDSVWTLNAASMGSVELSTLSMKSVDEWREEHPAIEAKIQDYCLRFDKVNDFFISTGAERRQEERIPLAGSIHINLLDDSGKLTDTTIRGEGSDISTGGLSFLSRITQRKQARTLLGRQVKIFFSDSEGHEKQVGLSGTVVAVRNLYSAEPGRSVHISFDTELEAKKMTDLINGN